MKVLFFSNTSFVLDSQGSDTTGNWSSALINSLRDNINDIEIFYAFHDLNVRIIELSESNDSLSTIRIPLHGSKLLIVKLYDKRFRRDLYKKSLNDYLSIIEKVRPDIIQIFGLESPYIRIIGNTAIPIIVHIQGLLPPYMFKFYTRFTSFEIFRSLNVESIIRAQTPFYKKAAIKRQIKLEESIYSDCKYFFGRTDWDRYVLKSIAPNAKYFYCQEIMREPFYHYIWEQKRGKIFRIFTTIRDVFYKNVDIIFEVTNLLEKYNSDFEFQWFIAGIDENDISVKVMRRKGFGSQRLVLLGSLKASDLVQELLKSDLFVIPSAIENSPNALQEAMLIGMPVIATHAGGISSLIEHGKTGLLVPEGEPFSLAGAILELKDAGEKIRMLGSNARLVSMERNNPGSVVNSLISAYNEIITRENKGQ
jgi:glycosyltransferase involved in cell wall biosynthesis